MGHRKEVVKPTGGLEHCNDQSQCQGCFSLGYTHCQVGRDLSQVKQGCTHSAPHLLQALPGMASPGSVGQMCTSCHQEAMHLYGYYMLAEKAASVPTLTPPKKLLGLPFFKAQNSHWVQLVKHSAKPKHLPWRGAIRTQGVGAVPGWRVLKELHKWKGSELIPVPRFKWEGDLFEPRRSQGKGQLIAQCPRISSKASLFTLCPLRARVLPTTAEPCTRRSALWSFLSGHRQKTTANR